MTALADDMAADPPTSKVNTEPVADVNATERNDETEQKDGTECPAWAVAAIVGGAVVAVVGG